MVGGASKMAAVRKLVTNLFGVDPRRTVDPMQARYTGYPRCTRHTRHTKSLLSTVHPKQAPAHLTPRSTPIAAYPRLPHSPACSSPTLCRTVQVLWHRPKHCVSTI